MDKTEDSVSTAPIHPFLIKYPFRKVKAAYESFLVRTYCEIRAHILRDKLLREIGQFLPSKGLVAEVGCGFGLFANCFAISHPNCSFICCDLSNGRIMAASKVAGKLGINNVRFEHANAIGYLQNQEKQDCIYMLDVIHHLPPNQWSNFLDQAWECLKPGGTLIIKDVSDTPWHKMAFTWILDILMTKFELPNYLPEETFLTKLQSLGGETTAHTLDDYLPYPHMLYVSKKPY